MPKANDSRNDLKNSLYEVQFLPHCPAKLDAIQAIIDEADQANLLEMSILARREFIECAVILQRGDRLIPALAWNIATARQHPELMSLDELVYDQCESLGQMANFDFITRQQFNDILQDLNLATAGNVALAHRVRLETLTLAPDLGDADLARAILKEVGNKAVSLEDLLCVYSFLHDVPALRRVCKRVVKSRNGYFWAPASLLPLLAHGERELADQILELSGEIKSHVAYQWMPGYAAAYLSLTGELDRAIKLFRAELRRLSVDEAPLSLLHFFLDMRLVLSQCIRRGKVKMQISGSEYLRTNGFPTRLISTSELIDFFGQRLHELIERFDKRNGNQYFSQLRQRYETVYDQII